MPSPTGVGDDPSLTADMLELYFDRGDGVGVARRAPGADIWMMSELVPVTTSTESTPEIKADGLELYVKHELSTHTDIYRAKRDSMAAAWSALVEVSELNSPMNDEGGSMTDDGTIMVMSSTRSSGDPNYADIYEVRRANVDASWGTPKMLGPAVNSDNDDSSPMISGDGLTLWFHSNRDGANNQEIYEVSRASRDDDFGDRQVLSRICDAATDDTDPWVSPNGRTIFFVSARSGEKQLYTATR